MKRVILFSLLFLVLCQLSVLADDNTDMEDAATALDEEQQRLHEINKARDDLEASQQERVFLITDASVHAKEAVQAKDYAEEEVIGVEDAARKSGAKGQLQEIELSEDKGQLVYEIKTVKQGKLFWLFSIDVPVRTIVTARSGETEERYPWYNLLVAGLKSDQ